MTERKRRLYRAVITETPGKPVPRMVYNPLAGIHSTEPIYLAEYIAPEGPHGERAQVDPFDPETIDLDIPSYEMRGPRMWVDWRVGKSRRYFSRARAERTANLWRAMGYIVRVDESDPIVWPAS